MSKSKKNVSDSDDHKQQEMEAAELKGKCWLQRLWHLHPPSFLFYIALSNVVEGMGHMRLLCYLNIYKDVFKLEASLMQTYSTIQAIPVFFKVFTGLAVDLKVIK